METGEESRDVWTVGRHLDALHDARQQDGTLGQREYHKRRALCSRHGEDRIVSRDRGNYLAALFMRLLVSGKALSRWFGGSLDKESLGSCGPSGRCGFVMWGHAVCNELMHPTFYPHALANKLPRPRNFAIGGLNLLK